MERKGIRVLVDMRRGGLLHRASTSNRIPFYGLNLAPSVSMKTAQIQNYGPSDQIQINDIPVPVLKPDEVMVKIHEAGVNPVDWKIREGVFSKRLPFVLGQDFAGEITEIGKKIESFQVGARVAGFASRGAYAEYAAIQNDKIVELDDSISDEIAAALPTPGLTAYQIVMAAEIKPGQSVLVHGASGSVGSLAVQIANWKGGWVIANASDRDADFLKKNGAQQVIDYKTQRFEDLVENVDAVLDLVGGETATRSAQVLKETGKYVSTVGSSKKLSSERVRIGLPKVAATDWVMKQDMRQLAFLFELVKNGTLQVRVAKTFPLSEAKQAQDLNQFGRPVGKVLLKML